METANLQEAKKFKKEITLVRAYSILMKDNHGQVIYTFDNKVKADRFYKELIKNAKKFKRRKCRLCEKLALQNRSICWTHKLEIDRKKREDKLAKQAVSKQKKKVIKTAKRELSIKYLDDLWSLKTKEHYGRKCEHCGKTENLNSHHVIGRTNKALRWDYRNCVVLCVYCHKFNHFWSAHETPTIFNDWIRSKRGEEWHTDLVVKARNTNVDRKLFLEELRKINGQDISTTMR